MKSRSILMSTVILAVLLFVLAIPSGSAMAAEKNAVGPHEIFFWVYNESQFDFTLHLYGPAEYTITVPPHSEGFFVLKNGWYAFTMYSCNLVETGTLDFTNHKTFHVPICGGTAGATGRSNNHYDSSNYIRPASIFVRNRTLEPIGVYIRTLDEHHFLNFEPLEERHILIEDASQEFAYSYVACGELRAGMTRLYISLPFDLTCSKD